MEHPSGAHTVVDAEVEAGEEVGGEVGRPDLGDSEEVEVQILLVRVYGVSNKFQWCWSFYLTDCQAFNINHIRRSSFCICNTLEVCCIWMKLDR